MAVICVVLAALLAAPATWAAETVGHATNGTFPTGGPASASIGAGGPGFGRGRPGTAGGAGLSAPGVPGFGGPRGAAGFGGGFGGRPPGAPSGLAGAGGSGPMFGAGSSELTAAVRYAKAHGGGTIGVSSQSSAASLILFSHADVAGLGGFSGRESSVSASWIASEVRSGRLRWILADSRTGSQSALAVVERTCRRLSFTNGGQTVTMYDCQGRASAIMADAGNQAG